jgi:hypothetical protein
MWASQLVCRRSPGGCLSGVVPFQQATLLWKPTAKQGAMVLPNGPSRQSNLAPLVCSCTVQ